MHKKTDPKIPSFRYHKATGQGFVVLEGQYLYLGRHDLPGTREKYHRLIAEWLQNGRQLPVSKEEITVAELAAAYWRHAQGYYVKPDGRPTSSLESIRCALKPLNELYGTIPAVDFGPSALRVVREGWIKQGSARSTINTYTSLVKRMFRWAVAHEMIPANAYQALETVDGLKTGRSDAKETAPVCPAPQDHIEAVRPHLSRQVNALINLQLLTGARAGELVGLRPVDIDTSGEIWAAKLVDHKTVHRGRTRTLYFGPKAQAVLRDFLVRPVDAFLFSPQEAQAERYARCTGHRRPGQRPTALVTSRRVGESYSTASYRQAIRRACIVVDVPVWTPHQLRHNVGESIRRDFGLDGAQVILGHSNADITQVYADVDGRRISEILKAVG